MAAAAMARQIRSALHAPVVHHVQRCWTGSYSAAIAVQKLKDIPPAVYGGRHTVTVIPGDGIGPELMAFVKEVVRFTGAPVDFEEVEVTKNTTEAGLDNAILAVMRNGVGLKGTIETNHHSNQKSHNIALRKTLDLFASVVRCQSLPFVVTKHSSIDIVIIRENTEGEYSQLEHENVSGVVESLKIITELKSRRIAKYAFDYAARNGRKKITAVHKANIMKLSDGLFLECCRDVAKQYPAIEFGDMIVDNCAMQMVSRPQQFDVMVMPNLYGNILVNVAAGLVGGPGVVVGANFGEKLAVFEQGTRNSGRSIKGKNIANPSAMLMATADMLRHIGLHQHGAMVHDAVVTTMTNPLMRTADLGGKATTLEVVQAIIQEIKAASRRT